MRKLVRLSLAAFVLAAVCGVLLIAASIYTFAVLTDETLIAEVRFEATGPESYRAFLRTGDFCDEQALDLFGDQWRIDAEFVKWHYWALLLGLDSQYRLDRFEGRYSDVRAQNSGRTLAHSLAQDTALDVVALAQSLGRFNFLLDATYGSSTYQAVDPARIHLVYKSPTGIFTRSREIPELVSAAAAAQASALPVEIRRGCGDRKPGIWQRAVRLSDSTIGGLL
jgi:hypothetical protein